MTSTTPNDEISRRDAIKRIAIAAAWFYGANLFTGCGRLPSLVLDETQRQDVCLLADSLLPMAPFGPSPSSQKIDEFVNEWISAEYPAHRADRSVILKGLAAWKEWQKDRADNRQGAGAPPPVESFLAHIASPNEALYPFFTTFRRLVVGGYYTTEAGWAAIGYVGNVALPEFPGAPAHILKQIGVSYDEL